MAPCAVNAGGVVGSIERLLLRTTGAVVRARPKSSSFAPDFVSITFAGLEVAVDDAGAVRPVESISDLDRNRHCFRDGQLLPPGCSRSASVSPSSTPAPGNRCRPRVQFVERADVRVIERRDDARLPIEPLAEVRIAGDRFWQNFDGDCSIEARVLRAVHLAHAASADQRDDFVRAEAGAGREAHPVIQRNASTAISGGSSWRPSNWRNVTSYPIDSSRGTMTRLH